MVMNVLAIVFGLAFAASVYLFTFAARNLASHLIERRRVGGITFLRIGRLSASYSVRMG